MHLLDTNVWLALSFTTHKHHPAAKNWYDHLAQGICHFCRNSQQGFLRLATNPQTFPADAVSMTDAWKMYDGIMADPRISFLEEPPGLEPYWRQFTQGRTFSPKVWNDAYLAAFAEADNLEVVTFDQGFKQFPLTRLTILS